MEKKKNLFRIDTGRTHGWQVRIIRNGERHTKLFSDKKYGGKESAYEKALAHRNEMLEELPDLPDEGPLHTDEVHERRWEAVTRTGVKGIGFTMTTYSRATDAKRPYITAHWPGEDRWRCTSFSIVKHGLRGALNEAAETLVEHADPDLTAEEMVDTARPAVESLLKKHDVADAV
ncbi:MAG: AP2 domain-containing protein [Salinibacter sp.]|uniref:AP2 domain-containing protein n=1 Tax=Salinibacter sp. TaxID=2065818 RepID=UPI0035D48BC1